MQQFAPNNSTPNLTHLATATHNKINNFIHNKLSTPTDKTLTHCTPLEVKGYITTLKKRKAPGIDNIKNQMLIHLPTKAIVFITNIFNACIRFNYFPKAWKIANVVAIHKVGSPANNPTSYRPISLLPAIGKLFEKSHTQQITAAY